MVLNINMDTRLIEVISPGRTSHIIPIQAVDHVAIECVKMLRRLANLLAALGDVDDNDVVKPPIMYYRISLIIRMQNRIDLYETNRYAESVRLKKFLQGWFVREQDVSEQNED